jgi:hypothetical protein
MITTTQIADAFGRNVALLQRQAAGLTQADSLLQPPFRGNCLNWVLGHLASNRDTILQTLDAAPVIGEAGSRYERDSEPITTDGADVLPLEELLQLLTPLKKPLSRP